MKPINCKNLQKSLPKDLVAQENPYFELFMGRAMKLSDFDDRLIHNSIWFDDELPLSPLWILKIKQDMEINGIGLKNGHTYCFQIYGIYP
jgi:hypothetical protein